MDFISEISAEITSDIQPSRQKSQHRRVYGAMGQKYATGAPLLKYNGITIFMTS